MLRLHCVKNCGGETGSYLSSARIHTYTRIYTHRHTLALLMRGRARWLLFSSTLSCTIPDDDGVLPLRSSQPASRHAYSVLRVCVSHATTTTRTRTSTTTTATRSLYAAAALPVLPVLLLLALAQLTRVSSCLFLALAELCSVLLFSLARSAARPRRTIQRHAHTHVYTYIARTQGGRTAGCGASIVVVYIEGGGGMISKHGVTLLSLSLFLVNLQNSDSDSILV